MSAETLTWLNRNVLVGFTDKRGHAWHYKASEQGDEPNHYPGGIPVADVMRRLFTFEVVPRTVFVAVPCDLANADSVGDDGQPIRYVVVPEKQAMTTTDTDEALGIFSLGYEGHQYAPWLVDNVANLLDDELQIGSAGLLRNRAQAWVSVEVPDNITTPEGVEFRPNLLACTSFDGSLATTYKRTVTAVVCDNTLAAGLGEDGQTFKVKHTRRSSVRIADAREALAIVYSTADEFSAEVARLCSIGVTERQFRKLLDSTCPFDPDSKRSTTLAENKRAALSSLYQHDERVAPWRGTAFGVLQAFNTNNAHMAPCRGERVERNLSDALTGRSAKFDADVLATLETVLT